MMQQQFKWIHTSIHPHGCIYNKEEARGHQMTKFIHIYNGQNNPSTYGVYIFVL
jgi:hypothetical protein